MRLALIALALTACQSSITGNEGNFTFAYWTDDAVDFNKPIAVGGSLDIRVADVGRGQPVTLSAASTDDPSLEVASFSGDTLTVRGAADGGALLSVEGTTAAGVALGDSINLSARTPEVLKLVHSCGDGSDVAYLAGQRAWIPFDLELANGQPVIGYGYYPVQVEGTAVTLAADASDQAWLAVDTAASPGTATLVSDLDATTLAVRVVAASSIDGAAEPVAFVAEDLDVGDTNAFYVFPSVAGAPVCQADIAKTVVSDTPDVCAVRDADAADPDAREFGWFEIEGLSAGECAYTVTFPDGNGGAGASASFTYPIEP